MFGKIALFELRYQLRNPVFWVATIIFFLLVFGAMASDDITIGGGLSSSDAIPAAVAQQFCTERAHTADRAFFCVSFGSCAVCQDIRRRPVVGLWGCANNPPSPLRCSTRAADHGENLQNRCVKLLGETDKVVRTQCLICSSL